LIEERGGERDAELHGRDGKAAFFVRVRGVVRVDFGQARAEITTSLQLAPNALDAVCVFDDLAVVGFVTRTIEISFTHDVRREAQLARDAIHHFFDEEHALWAAKAAKCRM